jgi:predicted MFS family arabinose efflux permease
VTGVQTCALPISALILLALTRDTVSLLVVGAVYGIGFGSAQPALISWCAELVGPAERGRAMGTYYTAFELGIALGAGGAGLVVNALGFTGMFVTAAAVGALGSAAAWLPARPSRPP